MVLLLLGLGGGWLGGVLSAVISLQDHWTAPVEHVGDLAEQERTRFHVAWWTRWFWGPWIGAGLTLVVIALVRSGVLVFTSSFAQETQGTPGLVEKFASVGLGGLVGLGSKDVVERLLDALKTWLRVEEPEVKRLEISPKDAQVKYGEVTTFQVTPRIPVTWTLHPSDSGTIVNGTFQAPASVPPGAPDECRIIITAVSKRDPDRSASAVLVLKK